MTIKWGYLWFGALRLYVSRKARKPDEWDPPIAAYDPYGPGTGVSDHDIED
jgi:hypothetical protein